MAQLEWLAGWLAHLCQSTCLFFSFPLRIESTPFAMADQLRSKIIEDNPIGNGLDAFHASFNTVCTDRTISRVPDALGQLDQEGMTAQLF